MQIVVQSGYEHRGILSIEQLRGIAMIAKKYGTGSVHCTTRQTIEIPHVNPKSLKKIEKSLEKNGNSHWFGKR